jgi:hypothetical protein
MLNKKLNIYFIYIVLLIFFTGCVNEEDTFTGYLVSKEYTPKHMSNENKKTIIYNSLIPIVYVPHVYTPHSTTHEINEKWVWVIANRC